MVAITKQAFDHPVEQWRQKGLRMIRENDLPHEFDIDAFESYTAAVVVLLFEDAEGPVAEILAFGWSYIEVWMRYKHFVIDRLPPGYAFTIGPKEGGLGIMNVHRAIPRDILILTVRQIGGRDDVIELFRQGQLAPFF